MVMRWKTLIVLGSLIILLSACEGPQQKISTSPASLQPRIAIYSAAIKVPSGQKASVSASCKAGEQMLGGGFESGDLFEYAASIRASYPSSPTTWTVTGRSSISFFYVTVLVYCLQTKLPLASSIAQTTAAYGAKVACPRGTVLLNEGFDFSQAQDLPNLSGSGGNTVAPGVRYALCAANHVLSGKTATAIFNPHSTANGYHPGDGKANCPTGQIATGGAFTGTDTILGSSATGADFAGWSITAGGDDDMTISAICVIFQADAAS